MVLGCLFFPLLLIFRPMMLILGLIGLQGRQERKIPVTTITIQQSSGSMHSARIEGDLMGVGLNQGDYVSLWGRDRTGTLIVKRGYNHTMHGDIQVRSRHSHLISRTVAIALLVFIVYVLLMISLSSVR